MLKLRKLTENEIKKVRLWRMNPEVSKYMFSDPEISQEDQIKWFKKVNLSNSHLIVAPQSI